MALKQIQIKKTKVEIPNTIQYWFVFLLLTFLCYQAHELLHHFLGAILCGGFGKMTFGIFLTKQQCKWENIVTLAGPLLTFAIAWLGMYILTWHKYILFGYTLVFASFAHLRFMLPLGKGGDEWLLARIYFHLPTPYLIAGILFLLGLPPIMSAFKAIHNRRRFVIFAISWLMPLIILITLSMVDNWLFASNPNNVKFALMGIPNIVLVTNLAAILLFIFIGNKILIQSETTDIINQQD